MKEHVISFSKLESCAINLTKRDVSFKAHISKVDQVGFIIL